MTKLMYLSIQSDTALYFIAACSILAVLIYYAIRALSKPEKENFYLLCTRLMIAAENAATFDDLDNVKSEFYTEFKKYATHEDFKDGYAEVNAAITERFYDLHKLHFKATN